MNLAVAVQVLLATAALALIVFSSLRAVPTIWSKVEARDVLLVVPDSGYFAPTPNTADYYLVARETAGQPWMMVLNSHRSYSLRLIDPHRRVRKAIVDLSSMFIHLDSARQGKSLVETRADVSTSFPYLVALGACTSATSGWSSVQFGLVRLEHRAALETVDMLAISDVHPVLA